MDLEIREGLALAEDRGEALSQLLPGSEDHDYYAALRAQHRGAFDEADTILDAWPGRHGSTERLARLKLRQLLCRAGQDPAAHADELRDHFGISHWHEAEVEEVDPTRPTKLAPGTFSGARLLAEAVERSGDLSQVTAEGLDELAADPDRRDLDRSRRRSMLQRLGHTAGSAIVEHVARDLDDGTSFGSVRIHAELTSDQLRELGERVSKLRADAQWLHEVIRRMRPPLHADLEDLATREAYLGELWSFVAPLPPATASLKAHVLWHLLDAYRRRDAAPPRELVLAYLQLPRNAGYLRRALIENMRSNEVAQLGRDFSATTGLPPAGSDEELVRDLVRRDPEEAQQYAPWIETSWLEAEIATAQLLAGTGKADRATQLLGPSRAAALRDRIDLVWCAHNPTRVGPTEPIVLEADVKNVSELVVKVFRIDALAYFQHHRREIGTDIDLDGLAASSELTLRFAEPPIRRVRRRIELPMCARAGTYVIDLIGNGMSSRAVVHKGRLRHVARNGAAGHVVTVLDESGGVLADARAWLGDREYTTDARGTFVVPFSTMPGTQPLLLISGDLASVRSIELSREVYELTAELQLDRQALAEGRTARAVARVRLSIAGAPASLALLERPTWEATLVDRHGISTTKQIPLTLSDDEAASLEIPLGESPAQVTVAVRGKVRVVSEQRDLELATSTTVQIATMHGSTATEALYLASTRQGFVIHALGKSGEPRARRPITVTLTHRWSYAQLVSELATDANGRCELGELPGISTIAASLGDAMQTWHVKTGGVAARAMLAVPSQRILLPVPPGTDTVAAIERASLVEVRGDAPARHVTGAVESLAGGISVRGLPAGDFALRVADATVAIHVAPSLAQVAGHAIGARETVELSRQQPIVESVEVGPTLEIRVADANERTRVHVIGTRFLDAPIPSTGAVWAPPLVRRDVPRPIFYVSGRELGDEYRYVLERRTAKRFPALQLDKPSLLLHPWARKTTSTDVAVARTGTSFGPSAPAPQAASYGYAESAAAPPEDEEAYAGYDFLANAPVEIANLALDEHGVARVPISELAGVTCATVVVDDPAGTSSVRVALDDTVLATRDLRLVLALDPARHAMQRKQIAPLATGDTIVLEDLATSKIHLIDSVERAHGYLLAIGSDSTLREWSFVTRWHDTPEPERRELYSKYACHELHLFLYFKDRAFFDAVVRPTLVHKRTKTFVDHWLLESELSAYLDPSQLRRLNAVERALLCHRMRADAALVRLLADAVELIPPDPSGDAELVETVLGASRLDSDSTIATATVTAKGAAVAQALSDMPRGAPGGGVARMAMSAPMAAPMPPPAPMAKKQKRAAERDDFMADDLTRRREAQVAPMFRAADKTQEWAEHNWWHKTPSESTGDAIVPNRLWRDLAARSTLAGFLSPWLGLAAGSFAESMCALAVTDLPFVPGRHAIVAEGPRLSITAAAAALAGSSQLVDGALVEGGPPLVVGQSYVRADDRYRFVDGEQVDKYVDGPLLAGVVYTCQVVLANPSSTRQRIAALVQIPKGSMPLAGARATDTLDVLLEPYGTHGHEVSFYFPATGRFTHYPVHVSRGEAIVAAAPARMLDVVERIESGDLASWPHVSQRGSLTDVLAFLERENLSDIELEDLAWRMRERSAYDQILRMLERRHAYDDTLWGYSVLHGDVPRIRTWVRARGDELLAAGPVLDMPLVGLDAEALAAYEHLEYAPLINARAHRLGPKTRILNATFLAQYERFLDLVAHRPAPTQEDLLAGASYLLAQDRDEGAIAMLARVRATAVTERMQHDYLAAYVACLSGDVTAARELVTRWRQVPVDRWRRKFEALAGMLAELEGAAPSIGDRDSRAQQQADLAARQPAFELDVDRDGVTIRQQNVASLELRMFEMDVELLFSRQPFVQSDVSRFSFIEPGHRETLADLPAERRIAWPQSMRGKNVVVEAVGPGLRKAKIHYANDLATNVANQFGQLRVQRASDKTVLSTTYVKVYARRRDGSTAFYKDGYTDLRGWFDYASLSTNELDVVDRFAILVSSDVAGATILEASPPTR